MLRLMTSADRRLAAISNVVRVRVEFSKNRLNTDRPRSSGTFFTSRSAIDANGTAVSRMRRMISAGRPSSVSRWVSSPAALSCGLRTARLGAERELCRRRLATARSTDGGRRRAGRRQYVGFDRQLAAAAVDQHGKLDARGPPVVEQLVDRRANAAPGVEHVVDQHDRRALDLERQLRALDLRASGPCG